MATALIKTRQSGTVVIAAGAASGTATLPTSVTTANAFVRFDGFTSPNSSSFDNAYAYPGVQLTNTNTVTAFTNAADPTYARTVYFTVIEYLPGVLQSNQQGTITLTSASYNGTDYEHSVTITGVNFSNAFALTNGRTFGPPGSSFNGDFNGIMCYAILDSSTTVTGHSGFIWTTDTAVLYYAVPEFVPGILLSVQNVAISMTDPATSGTATITSVTTSNCLSIFQGWAVTSYQIGSNLWEPIITLTNSTTVTANILAAAGFTPPDITKVNGTIVEFNSGYINSKNAGTTVITAGTSTATSTLGTSVNPLAAIISYLNWNDSNGSDNGTTTTPYNAAVLTNATTVTVNSGGTNPSSTITVGWEVVEFFINTLLTSDTKISFEENVAVSKDHLMRGEWIENMKIDRLLPFEETGGIVVVKDHLLVLESLARVRSDTNAFSEGLSTLKADFIRLEFLASQQRDAVPPLDTSAGIVSDSLAVDETLWRIISDSNAEIEIGSTFNSNTPCRLETTANLQIDKPLLNDWIIGIVKTDGSIPMEMMFSRAMDVPVLGETVRFFVGNQLMRAESLTLAAGHAVAENEAMLTARGDANAATEALAKAQFDAISGLENIGTFQVNQSIPLEVVTQTVRADAVLPQEFMRVVQNNIVGFIESLFTARLDAGSPGEFAALVTRHVPAPGEVLALAAKDTGAMLEILSNALNNFTNNNMPFEIVVAVKSDAKVPFASELSVQQDGRAFQEFIASIAGKTHLNIAWDLRVIPPTSPNRIFKVVATIR